MYRAEPCDRSCCRAIDAGNFLVNRPATMGGRDRQVAIRRFGRHRGNSPASAPANQIRSPMLASTALPGAIEVATHDIIRANTSGRRGLRFGLVGLTALGSDVRWTTA
jgi:hypothetical protein